MIGEGFRGATGEGDHAEFGLLRKLKDVDLTGATVYTTLEPCSRRNHPKNPCADLLAARHVGTVFIGMYDPNPRIYREGWRTLRDAGIVLKDFDADLRAEIEADGREFVEQYRRGVGPEGEAIFDYRQNDGRFDIHADDGAAVFHTRWTMAGKAAIYAYDHEGKIGHPRYAVDFSEIDDPGALDFSSTSHLIRVGEIAVFRNEGGYALVRVENVLSGADYGDDHTELQITYQLRVRPRAAK
jgi:diaminohydroxyphosphoribosylaminopyrimidine deaminase/5-amino-6-(5-phosphoribosylamino)uracil reductase